MSQRTNALLRKVAQVKKALERQALRLKLPHYIIYAPVHMKPREGEQFHAFGETLPEFEEPERQAAALHIPIKEYGFDPDEVGTEMEPSPVPVIEFRDWGSTIPPAIDTE